jgi:hypothetical protein
MDYIARLRQNAPVPTPLVTAARHLADYRLEVTFADGTQKLSTSLSGSKGQSSSLSRM